MPSFPCRHQPCGEYLPAKGYCAAHAEHEKIDNARRHQNYDLFSRDPEVKQFYNSAAWCHPTHGARAIKLRSQPFCERCNEIAEHVHHIVPVKIATPAQRIDQRLLFSICKICHPIVEAEQAREREAQ